jgi:hypothetical protein
MIPRLSMACQQPFSREIESRSVGDKQQLGNLSSGSGSDIPDDMPNVMGLGGWQLHRASDCHLGRKLEGLHKGSSARDWLRTHRKDAFAMTAMRKALLVEGWSLSLTRLRDEDIIEQAAHLLKSGLWHVCEPVVQLHKAFISEDTGPSAFVPVPRRGPRSPEPPPPARDIPEEDTLAGNADQAAIAAVLANAASSGIPFCEECAKAARMASKPAGP